MAPEKVVKCSAVHGQRWIERALIVMVVLCFNFGLGRYTTRAVKDADLSSAGAEVEQDVMNIRWPVEEAIYALASKFIVLFMYQPW
jgi:hypothetical protein